MTLLQRLASATSSATLHRRLGAVEHVYGLTIESLGPDAELGETCRIATRSASASQVHAEVVGVRNGRLTLMPFGPVQGLAAGCEVEALGHGASIPVGDSLLGRVVDGFGEPLDGRVLSGAAPRRSIKGRPLNPMTRPRISRVLETGVRSIDALLTVGQGQRMGIFAGSGVGKSTLLGMIARHVRADVNVIALIGERGREVREFIDKQLGPEGLARSVVVVATSDQPALARIRAAHAAVAIAEAFRDEGRQVVLTMDSVTRLAMARREVGLASGEPPTARGYTPSVFAEIPELCERCGTADSGGSITALLTVLVEGDDFNEPVADLLRATLDGHIVLTRRLAQMAQFPAIDVLESTSRVMGDIVPAQERAMAQTMSRLLALLQQNRQLVDIGAYVAGSNPGLDKALALEPALRGFLEQAEGGVAREQSLRQLAGLLSGLPGGLQGGKS